MIQDNVNCSFNTLVGYVLSDTSHFTSLEGSNTLLRYVLGDKPYNPHLKACVW